MNYLCGRGSRIRRGARDDIQTPCWPLRVRPIDHHPRIGVEPILFYNPHHADDRDPGRIVTLTNASADGIAVRRAGDRTLPLVQKYVDDIVTVEEEEIANAILLLLEREKTLAEGAGAAALAALVNRKLHFVGKKVAVLVCGGNIDVTLLSRIIERGLVKDGRLVRLRVHLPVRHQRGDDRHRRAGLGQMMGRVSAR